MTFSKCKKCNKPLKNKNSKLIGFGPICARNLGLEWETLRKRLLKGKPMKGYKRTEVFTENIVFEQEIYVKRVNETYDEKGDPLLFPINYIETNVPLHAVEHSPSGFEWGYKGSGPSDLAMNIVQEVLVRVGHKGEKERVYKGDIFSETRQVYQYFMEEFISVLPEEGGSIPYKEALKWISDKITLKIL
jgi:hypothetical protein